LELIILTVNGVWAFGGKQHLGASIFASIVGGRGVFGVPERGWCKASLGSVSEMRGGIYFTVTLRRVAEKQSHVSRRVAPCSRTVKDEKKFQGEK